MEGWRDILKYEGFYKVSSLGRVKSYNDKIKSEWVNNKGISYRQLGIDFSKIRKQKYKNAPNIKLPSDVREYFKDNTVLNTLIAQGKVLV